MSKKKTTKLKLGRKQKLAHQKQMEIPMNVFLNAKGTDGKLKYEVAQKIWAYTKANPDPALNEIRMSNALVHEIRLHLSQAEHYLVQHKTGEPTDRNEYGTTLTVEQCYLKYIAETQASYLALAKLREQLFGKVLTVCDGDIFTFDQYNAYVLGVEEIINELGYELFPTTVSVIKPL